MPSLLDTGAPSSGEGDFVFVKVGKEILLYRCYIPFKKFEKKNLRHEMIFCTKLAEIGPVNLEKKISKNCQHIFTMSLQSFESLISCLSFTVLWYVIISTFYDMVFV